MQILFVTTFFEDNLTGSSPGCLDAAYFSFFLLSLLLKFMSWILLEDSKIIFKNLSWFCFCFPGLA